MPASLKTGRYQCFYYMPSFNGFGRMVYRAGFQLQSADQYFDLTSKQSGKYHYNPGDGKLIWQSGPFAKSEIKSYATHQVSGDKIILVMPPKETHLSCSWSK